MAKPDDAVKGADEKPGRAPLTMRERGTLLISLSIVIILAGGLGIYYFLIRTPEYEVGVLIDEPGVNYSDPGTAVRSGFEISMLDWMSRESSDRFNYDADSITIPDRERRLNPDSADPLDFVFASFTITDDRLANVKFAGPYLYTQQGVMVKRGGPLASLTRPQQLIGRIACAQSESTSAEGLKSLVSPDGGKVILREMVGLRDCVNALQRGEVEAVSTDQILLKGYAADPDFPGLTVPNSATFGPIDGYGIGVPLDNDTACFEMEERIKQFIVSGRAAEFHRQAFGYYPSPGVIPPVSAVNACLAN